MRIRAFQVGEGGQLRGQTAEGLRAGHDRGQNRKTAANKRGTQETAENGQEHTPQRRHGPGRKEPGRTTGEQASTGEKGPRAPGRDYDSGSRESGRAASGQLQISRWTTSAETKLRLRAMDSLRERKTVNVSR